jgi:hypothetical protein
MNISINQRYKGYYEHLGTDKAGTAEFASWQAVDVSPLDKVTPGLEFNAVNWSVDKKGKLAGKAVFQSAKSHALVKALLSGTSPAPPKGQKFREAFVNVTFEGGTGNYKGATGKAKVEAKLFDDGSSEGTIQGDVSV